MMNDKLRFRNRFKEQSIISMSKFGGQIRSRLMTHCCALVKGLNL